MKYIIVGAGPTGLSLAYNLSKKLGFEVLSISDELWCNSNDWVIDRLPNGADMAVLLFTGGTTTQASATVEVYPPSLPTTPQILDPVSFAN